jgi:misacylated tRNA(Ala) deacylase
MENFSMTTRLYHDDSYIKEFTATVVSLDSDEYGIVLDQTAFYPGGGGQPKDKGLLVVAGEEYEVSDLKQNKGQISHILSPSASLPKVGDKLSGKLDWQLRYQMMRTHTAMHVLCGVIFRDYGASVTGGNMTPLQGRMDFEFATLTKELVAVIEDSVNFEISASHPVSWRTIPREEAFTIPDLIRTKINLLPKQINQVRVVEIHGLDLQADGGTHVRNTSEVGKVRITDYKSKGRENKRIYLEVSD